MDADKCLHLKTLQYVLKQGVNLENISRILSVFLKCGIWC